MRDETDQKELLLGNKQLLSIFFIVVAMLGVAFTLGYMIGRNTANVSAAGISPTSAVNPAVPTQSPNPSSSLEENPPPAPEPAPVQAAKPKLTMTSAAKPYGAAPAPAPNDDSETAPVSTPAAAPVPAASGVSYLQIAAMKRPDADHMVSVLGARGFPALVRDSSKEGLFRVLVGPYRDMPSLVDAKQKLKAAGFENPLISH